MFDALEHEILLQFSFFFHLETNVFAQQPISHYVARSSTYSTIYVYILYSLAKEFYLPS